MNNTKPGLQWAKTETFLISSTCRMSPHRSTKVHLQDQQVNRKQGWMKRERKKKRAESIASTSWSADVNQTDRDVREQRISHRHRMKGWLQSMLTADSERPVVCWRFGHDYLDRWCRCPRSPACRYTGVLWWCWCRWRSHRTNSGRWRTRHALRRTKRSFYH